MVKFFFSLRYVCSFLLILPFALSPIPALAQTSSTPTLASEQSQIITLANVDRAASGVAQLKENSLLDAGAQQKANDMLAKQYFAHNSPEGITPWYWVLKSSYIYKYAGENLAMDFYDAGSVEAAWMASPLHRKNIVDAHYKDVGIGIAHGTYQGKDVVFIVELFGAK